MKLETSVVFFYSGGILAGPARALIIDPTTVHPILLSGRFNFLGSSHNAWHIGIIIAFMYMQISMWTMMNYRNEQPC